LKPKLIHTDSISRKNVNKCLAKVRSLKPNEVVIWYSCSGQKTGVSVSEGVERVKAVGALTIAAKEVWDA
jgi:hypothetical protein